uniref:Pyrin domain-containing protein n=1 Tax=Cyprinodon variegatus TaxID=28743 RepID=A0A3Q2C9S1_CYPVA
MTEDILNTLDELSEEEFERFKWFLQQPENLPALPTLKKKDLEKAKRLEVVDLMIKTYALLPCLELTLHVLKKIYRNDLQPALFQEMLSFHRAAYLSSCRRQSCVLTAVWSG